MTGAVYRRLICLLVMMCEVLGSHFYPYYHKSKTVDECDSHLRRALHRPIETQTKPDLTGTWSSTKCEVRPGPEFLLRKYIFSSNRSFEIHQYYYADVDCTLPTYVVIATGSYKNLGESWTIIGGTNAKYYLYRVDIIPYNSESASKLGNTAKTKCPTLNILSWEPFQRHTVLQLAPPTQKWQPGYDFECTNVFNLTFHELQLIRMELHHHKNKDSPFEEDLKTRETSMKELYLGDIHTDASERLFYRPTGYQVALKPSKNHRCRVCSEIGNSNIFYPPKLHHRHPVEVNIVGDWVSSRCETRPHGQFLTRRLTFFTDGRSWQGKYDFYNDPLCRDPSFSISAKGRHTFENNSLVIAGAQDYNLRVVRLKITPKDHKTVEIMNFYYGHKCGPPKSWKIGVEQDVTSTDGCETLGIVLPKIEYQLIKFEMEHQKELLFIGQRPTLSNDMSSRNKRPTSFQAPLIKCRTSVVSPITVNGIFEKQRMFQDYPVDSGSSNYNASSLLVLNSIVVLVFLGKTMSDWAY